MKRVMLAATAIALAGCANFSELEAAALDAGRSGAGGGAAGGTSGGSAGGGTAGGTSGGSAGGTSGGSAGGTSGGSAGGTSGGSAGGTSGGSAGGTSGGSAGGMSGGSAGGTSGGAAAGGSAGLALEGWSGAVASRATATYAIAASAVDELVVEAYAEADGGTRVRANGAVLSQVMTALEPADLDARFGMATVVLNDTLWLFADGQWSSAPPGAAGTFMTAPVYRRGQQTFVSLYTYVSGTGALVETFSIEDGGFSGPASTLPVPALGQPSRLRVRPDSSGMYGSIVSDTYYARIETTNPASIDGSNDMLLVASSESQNSIVGGSQQGSTPGALFWFPGGETALNQSPDVRVDSQATDAGGVFTRAVATNGSRHAAILGPARSNDVWTTGDAGVAPRAGEWALFVFGAGQPRFISLGTAPRPPFDLAFGTRSGTHGLFVMANCAAPAADGGICSGAGSVVGFLAQP